MSEGHKDLRVFSLDHLDSVQFEQFCYDLLVELNFVNVNWRKGTGLSSSPSDQGRDLQCQFERTDVDGGKYLETWFVECKHWKRGVPAAELDSVIAAATSQAIDVVLVIVSNFLANSAKQYLETYEYKNRPRFRIKVWEKPDLQRLTLGRTRLLREYCISESFPVLALMHPAHIEYVIKAHLNTLDYFLSVLDQLDPEKRGQILSWGDIWISHIVAAVSQDYETIDLLCNETPVCEKRTRASYEEFKVACSAIAETNLIHEHLLVFGIVNWILQNQFNISDLTSVDLLLERNQQTIDTISAILEERPEDQEP